ncbi:hypothetical protein GW17_00031736 [Ensete ventricosum]|nr:hypothetical protein GW17_00031736 [Ensete ventricosum]
MRERERLRQGPREPPSGLTGRQRPLDRADRAQREGFPHPSEDARASKAGSQESRNGPRVWTRPREGSSANETLILEASRGRLGRSRIGQPTRRGMRGVEVGSRPPIREEEEEEEVDGNLGKREAETGSPIYRGSGWGAIGGRRQPSEAGRFTGVWVSGAALLTLSFLQPTVWSSSKVQVAYDKWLGYAPA